VAALTPIHGIEPWRNTCIGVSNVERRSRLERLVFQWSM